MIEKTTAYDAIPYLSRPFPETRPERLAAIARLFGLQAPAPEGCRVLEIGCSMGGNLLPMAQDLPAARFLGIDASSRQIAEGWKAVERLGLKNLELRQLDILEADELGEFDYIVSHGVFSWVPPRVQAKLLQICQRHLAPNGVAYVSYNTLPGWRMRGMIRDMMVYHSRQFQGAQQQIQQARALLDFLATSVPANLPYGMTLKQELDSIRIQPDSYIYHDHLEVVNEPVYFHEFAAAANRHGLQYLGDVEFSTMLVTSFPPQVAETLMRLGTDLVRAEQYMDFMRNRTFRQSLLVHDDVAINRKLQGGPLPGFHVSSQGKSDSAEPSLAAGVLETYHGAKGTLRAGAPITKAAMLLLRDQWPLSMPFEQLVTAARAKLGVAVGDGQPRPEDPVVLGGDMLQAYTVEAIELRMQALQFPITPSERPVASPLARWQAARGAMVTNLRHEHTKVDDFAQRLLPHLDGTRERTQLVEALAKDVAEGRLEIEPQGGGRLTGGPALRQVLNDAVDTALSNLARAALLVA